MIFVLKTGVVFESLLFLRRLIAEPKELIRIVKGEHV
jgi:hypothetical protein